MNLDSAFLEISPELMEQVKSHALGTLPEECCGVLVGFRARQGVSHVTSVSAICPVENSEEEDRRRGYWMAPAELLVIHKGARAHGEQVVGYYHSHPEGGAVPSERDREAAAPGVSYLIVGIAETEVSEQRSWRLREDGLRFEEEPLVFRSR